MMKGGLISVWEYSWGELWLPLQQSELSLEGNEQEDEDFSYDGQFSEICAELFVEIAEAFTKNKKIELDFLAKEEPRPKEHKVKFTVADIANDPELALEKFRAIQRIDFESESLLIDFFESAYDVITGFDDVLAQRYFILLHDFIEKYNLRYELAKPCRLYPTLPGIFTSLLFELHNYSEKDEHLNALMVDFNSALKDFREDQSETRIKTCVHKLINLLEALSMTHASVEKSETLGAACRELQTWPHATIQESLSKLYGFSSNFPGIRHAGKPKSRKRELEVRDLIALSIILAGYTPYLTEDIDLKSVYL